MNCRIWVKKNTRNWHVTHFEPLCSSAVACEPATTCKVVAQFCCCLFYLTHNIALYCQPKWQNNQLIVATNFDDTNIKKFLFDFLICHIILIKQIRPKLEEWHFNYAKSILNHLICIVWLNRKARNRHMMRFWAPASQTINYNTKTTWKNSEKNHQPSICAWRSFAKTCSWAAVIRSKVCWLICRESILSSSVLPIWKRILVLSSLSYRTTYQKQVTVDTFCRVIRGLQSTARPSQNRQSASRQPDLILTYDRKVTSSAGCNFVINTSVSCMPQ